MNINIKIVECTLVNATSLHAFSIPGPLLSIKYVYCSIVNFKKR